LQHKIKPAKGFLPELGKKEKYELLDHSKLPHQKYRYVVASTSFDMHAFMQQGAVERGANTLVIEYDGVGPARMFYNFFK
jgi:hypothetical protein